MNVVLGLLVAASTLAAQDANNTPDAHIAAAKAAAGEDFQNLFNFQCNGPGPGGPRAATGVGRNLGEDWRPWRWAGRWRTGAGGAAGPIPAWYAEPCEGALTTCTSSASPSTLLVGDQATSQGIIVLDTIFDYSVEEEVAGGMKKLGLDPANIKYAIVSHAHPDHDGGAEVSSGSLRHASHHVAGGLGCVLR